jgi:transketolase
MANSDVAGKKFDFGPRRAVYIDMSEHPGQPTPVSNETVNLLNKYDIWYRTLCSALFNFASSGHPGGSASSGHIVAAALLESMDYNIGDPDQPDADLFSYAAGHKALGLYAMWATRNEMVRASRPDLLPSSIQKQLRLEDMLGFRRNPTQNTPLFKKYKAKPLDGHPTPMTPFLRLSTGPSGVGVPASFGLAMGALDRFGANAPRVHILEGEGGLTPGRTSEALATAASAQLKNLICHIDWNQAAIDSDHVCRENDKPGDYVQWCPREYFYVHDWNVIWVPDGFNFDMVVRAQTIAKAGLNDQPTVIVYRTIKGWHYGIDGRKSHGAGHKFCSPEYYQSLKEFEDCFGVIFPLMGEDKSAEAIEKNYFDTLMVLRGIAEREKDLSGYVGKKLAESKERLAKLNRQPRADAPNLGVLYSDTSLNPKVTPDAMKLEIGSKATLRGELGKSLGYLNKITKGAFIGGAADLLGSTSVDKLNADFPSGFYNFISNPKARLIATGGICEDAQGAFMSGLSSFGYNIGVGASYAAFIAPLQHIAARVHCISQQAKHGFNGQPPSTFIIICGHAGLKTGEDGPTHADPQALQLLQENFPKGKAITLVPWDPQELWPLTIESLKKRPAVLAPFVTRPDEPVLDRKKLGLPPASAAVDGVYMFRKANPKKRPHHGTIVIQGSEVAYEFINYVLPRFDDEKLNMNVYYVASAELFDMLPARKQATILPEASMAEAMGISGFTMPTMHRWITSEFGRKHTLFSFYKGIYPGSGKADKVLEEMGLNGPAQWKAIKKYIKDRKK